MSKVYENCKIYGPYVSKADKRLRCMVIFPDKVRKTLSYPKYLVEVFLNKYLLPNETVDHIDKDFTNNDMSNLRVLTKSEHASQDCIRVKDVTCICKWCGKEFTIKGNLIRQRNRRTSSGYCSKSCTGKYGKYVQNGGEKKGKVELERINYCNKELLNIESILDNVT